MQVTTLVPAFKHQYFEQLLIALQSQVVKPARVIVSDDSPDGAFLRSVREGTLRELTGGLNLEVIEGPGKGHYANFRHLVHALPDRESAFHILCDDDLIYPEFYQLHLAAHRSAAALCSFSRRWIARESGQPVAVARCPPVVATSRQRMLLLDSEFLFRSTLPGMTNWLGEFSAAVFKPEAANCFLEPSMAGICHYGLYDLGIFLRSSVQSRALFINEHLGAFRRSDAQFSSQTASPVFRSSIVAWLALSVAAHNEGRLNDSELLGGFGPVMAMLRRHFANDPDAAKVIELQGLVQQREVAHYKDAFLSLWPLFLQHIDDSLK